MLLRRIALLLLLATLALPTVAAEPFKVRVGVLKFGTVNWALAVMQNEKLAEAEGIDLEVVELANKDGINVALQGGAVDVIVTDWLWVSRQRDEGRHYTFSPYSRAVGAVLVRPDAGIDTFADLKGKKLGIAGGPVDKSWLLLRAYSQQELGADAADVIETNFAAPPLLNQLLAQGDLDAVLNFWHFNAKLKAAGMRELIGVADILPKLGVPSEVPLLGWVFAEDWANDNKAAVQAFLRAAQKTQQMMVANDAVWETLRPQMKPEDEATFVALRDGYREGVPQHFGADELEAARKVFAILAHIGGKPLLGGSTTLNPGTFWDGYSF